MAMSRQHANAPGSPGGTGWQSMLSTVVRSGLHDPATVTALLGAATTWGATSATPYAAMALRHPGRCAVVDDYGRVSYLQLEVRTSRVAAALRRRGVARGDTVGLLCRNHRGFVEANIAIAKAGARVVYLNTGLPAAQLREVCVREQVSAIMADHEFMPRLLESDIPAELIPVAPESNPAWSFPDLARWSLPIAPPPPWNAAEPVLLTSGTSGAPKGTKRSAKPNSSTTAFGFLEAVPYRRSDVFVIPAPLFHAWGLAQLVLAATLGGTVVLRRRFDAQQVMDDVEDHAATVLSAVPVMLHRILDTEATADTSSLRITATSGSALPGDLAQRWMRAFGDNLYSMYGSTEVGQVSVATPTDMWAVQGTAGRPLRGIAVRILDPETHQPVDEGHIGDIVVASAMHFDGYTADMGSKEIFDGHMAIGDQGYLDAAGRLFVVGRGDDMIISGGENVFPSNIERALLANDEVSEAVVLGVPDDDLGQRIRAVVVPSTSGAGRSTKRLAADLKAALSDELANYEVPREFVFLDELPRNPSGKVLRRLLDGPAADIAGQR